MEHVQQLTLWITLLSAASLLVRVGQTLMSVGTVRSKNAASAISRGVCDLFVVVLSFTFIGSYLLLGGTHAGWITADADVAISPSALTLHYAVLVLIATGIVGPAVAERSRFLVPLVSGILLSVLVIPLAGRWVWYGWLRRMGFVDVAGAVPIHLAGAACAAAMVICVGPRNGKYNRDGSTNTIPGHHAVFTAIGALLMLAGWLPYVVGTSLLHGSIGGVTEAARAALNALVAAAAGGAAAAGVAHLRSRRNDLSVTCAGMLCGAVAMTAAGGIIEPWAAAVLGGVAGWLVPIVLLKLDMNLRVDDPGGNIATHGVGAIVGSLGVAVVSAGSIGTRLHLFGAQLLGVLVIGVLAFVSSYAVFAVLKAIVGLRVSDGDEFDGLDLAEHDVNAYPDFQQTMIKSYHTREA